MSFLALFTSSIFWSKNDFSYPKYQKKVLTELFSPKKKIRNRLIFDQKPWIIPFGKWGLFGFFETSISGQKIILFYPEYQKTIFSAIICAKKQRWEKKNRFLDKKHRLTLLENVDFLSLLKLQYSGLKIILFYPEYQKTIFSDLISPKNTNKKKFDFWTKTMDYPPRKMFLFFDFLKL